MPLNVLYGSKKKTKMIKRFSIQLIIRVIIMVATCLLIGYFFTRGLWFTGSGIGMLLIFQGVSLTQYVNKTNLSFIKFLDALKTEDYSVYFSPNQKGKSFEYLFNEFNVIIDLFKNNKIEKEAQFRHFLQILEQVNLGIISLKTNILFEEKSNEEILFLNQAASKILGIPKHKYWHRIEQRIPELARKIRGLKDGGKVLIELSKNNEPINLSLEVISVQFLDTPYSIITFQDIHSEIEQKEIEAWHNIIRVLAHEMLNSFTPVSSLATTIKGLTEDESKTALKASDLDDETVEDINQAANVIHRRSEGLLDFVKDYRTISNVPVPIMEEVKIKPFMEDIQLLMKPLLEKNKIEFSIDKIPPRAIFEIDQKLIEQVFINIIGNSVHALEGVENPKIEVGFDITETQIKLTILDNGNGIPESIKDQIFIPFFTTRKDGSGIGLSLSKNIMKRHKGQLTIKSEEGKFTEVGLIFSRVN